MDESKMIIPIEHLVNNKGNIYEVTNAAISRSSQLSKTGSKELDDNLGKIVSVSIKEIVTGKVKYNYEK
ncbi:MAG: DNA-directed RNA polymerase subunit omega [Spirochaetales bacterium]|nr:DNA-directed RNA polymerase subunit omega [Spirochaetales bacterium]